ncbi:uncharacterized protein LOC123378908 isoform X2 [Felis catus]|uniref:phospholipase A and acyltransferase 1 isoform X3 n=1 Tax=Felis catus TaxID=9685 RepID=UPI001D19FE5B|nr:phospholipase A and acyltransferase 1 isoform X3 [Felis catus]XP_044907468.1 uncharacterized protein LOC123378908 isoform X2 [Felis catus]
MNGLPERERLLSLRKAPPHQDPGSRWSGPVASSRRGSSCEARETPGPQQLPPVGKTTRIPSKMAFNDCFSLSYPGNPQPGDLIEVFRSGYQHWALYLGDGYVINIAPLDYPVCAKGYSRCWGYINSKIPTNIWVKNYEQYVEEEKQKSIPIFKGTGLGIVQQNNTFYAYHISKHLKVITVSVDKGIMKPKQGYC